jgi:D-xylose transport system substrate-binding protein
MSKRRVGVVAALAGSTLLLTACGAFQSVDRGAAGEAATAAAAQENADALASQGAVASEGAGEPGSVPGKACVILPDAASSARWETADRVYLEEAFRAAGMVSDIQNANGDKAKFATIADGMIAGGCTVMLITNLDSPSGAAVIEKAHGAAIGVIDYDRLTLGGGADYYVSFDNTAVGTAIGEGLIQCMRDNGDSSGPVALLNGSPTDNNATLFKDGYQTALEAAGYEVTADESVPDWDNTKAGTIFEQMYTSANGDFVGVAAANDGLAGAAIAVLDRNGQAGAIPVTGQDATDEGLQRVLLGTQCMTVYKAIKAEAEAAAQLAIAVATADYVAAEVLATGLTLDTETGVDVSSVLLEPQAIFPENVQDVVADGYTTAERLCTTPELKAACEKYGVQ